MIQPQDRAALSYKLLQIILKLQPAEGDWVSLAEIGSAFSASGIRCSQYGHAKLKDFLHEFEDVLEFRDVREGIKPVVNYARPREDVAPPDDTLWENLDLRLDEEKEQAEPTPESDSQVHDSPAPAFPGIKLYRRVPGYNPIPPAPPFGDGPSCVSAPTPATPVKPLERTPKASPLPTHDEATPIKPAEPAKQYQPTEPIDQIEPTKPIERLEAPAPAAPDKPVEPAQPPEPAQPSDPAAQQPEPFPAAPYRPAPQRLPTADQWLYSWAFFPSSKIDALVDMALEEKWYYGKAPLPEEPSHPILRNYLAHTFRRLCFEGKVLIRSDHRTNEEYAAFNTGLVDRKYEYIYALFKRNTRYLSPYWYLFDFVIPGEDNGKTLVSLFNPLPERANYFDKLYKIIYDTSTGPLICDYTHIIIERTDRLPLEFLKENCAPSLLAINGATIDDMRLLSPRDERRMAYFIELSQRIRQDAKTFKRLRSRIKDAVELAQKRTEWNYKTAVPLYFPTRNTTCLMLPLCLLDEGQVDLALVVERQESGAYQGQTILPLKLAYSNSRLVTQPDSIWLKPECIDTLDSTPEDEEE